jgi:GNAT superfamily N-acetyltransferase
MIIDISFGLNYHGGRNTVALFITGGIQVLNIKIRRIKPEDKIELVDFFRLVITDTFIKDGIENNANLEEEIAGKEKYLQYGLDINEIGRYFLIAEHRDSIIGTIEYGQSSELIDSCTNGELKDLVEVGTVFVRPDYQKQGVGNLLLNSIYQVMKDRGIEAFCLDSGYPSAQKIWVKKFGPPGYCLENYWGEGMPHMVWRIHLRDTLPT